MPASKPPPAKSLPKRDVSGIPINDCESSINGIATALPTRAIVGDSDGDGAVPPAPTPPPAPELAVVAAGARRDNSWLNAVKSPAVARDTDTAARELLDDAVDAGSCAGLGAAAVPPPRLAPAARSSRPPSEAVTAAVADAKICWVH